MIGIVTSCIVYSLFTRTLLIIDLGILYSIYLKERLVKRVCFVQAQVAQAHVAARYNNAAIAAAAAALPQHRSQHQRTVQVIHSTMIQQRLL